MTIKTLSPWILAFSLLTPLPACDDDDGGDDSAGDSANGESGGGEEGGGEEAGDESTSSSEETCVTNHSCINDVCQCDTPGLEGMACTDDEMCVDECEVCA